MRRGILIAGGALAALVVLGLAGGYVYYFSGIRTAPRALSLSTPSPSASAPAAPAPASGLAGSWTVGSGSVARYRVNEKFAGQSSSHEAVAESSSVSGTMVVSGAAGALTATGTGVVVDLASLHSIDSVLGFNVSNRDRIVSQTLSVQQFPQATFKADSFAIPAGLEVFHQRMGQPAPRIELPPPGQVLDTEKYRRLAAEQGLEIIQLPQWDKKEEAKR